MNNYRNDSIEKFEQKSNFWIKKDCAINSLKEVELFLHNLDKASRYIHLYKFLK